MIFGHEKARLHLRSTPAPVTLIQGPRDTGRRTLARQALKDLKILAVDMLEAGPPVTTAQARDLLAHYATRPMGPAKAAILDLDGSDLQVYNVLLKQLEEPPDRTHTIMLASKAVPLTIRSRALLITTGLLRTEDVERVLISKHGMAPEHAKLCAKMSGGTTSGALAAADLATAKGPVLSLLKAAAEGNEDLFYSAIAGWMNDHHDLLCRWVHECMTSDWRSFSRDETFGLANAPTLRKMHRALHTGCRPRIAAKLALLDVMESNR